jgi:hypothetical protein
LISFSKYMYRQIIYFSVIFSIIYSSELLTCAKSSFSHTYFFFT